MERVHLATTSFDLDGAITIELNASNEPIGARRRVNRVATLDGGAAFNDFGSSYADATITLSWNSTPKDKAVERLVQLYEQVRVLTGEGAFLAVPEQFSVSGGQARLKLLVIERLDA
jgi:hypothetical protein